MIPKYLIVYRGSTNVWFSIVGDEARMEFEFDQIVKTSPKTMEVTMFEATSVNSHPSYIAVRSHSPAAPKPKKKK